MKQRHYISVILPLKLEWEPCYFTHEKVFPGDRVKVKFANKVYIGAVSKIDVSPDVALEKIKEITSIERDMSSILPEEMELWKQVAEYYLCTVGEVFKAAYPAVKVNMEQARAEAKRKVCQRRAKTLEAIIARIDKLNGRLQKKVQKAESAKDGTKIKATAISEIEKLKEEIARTEKACQAAEASLKTAQEGIISGMSSPIEDMVTLSGAQERAYSEILQHSAAGKPVLLNGLTGSGKTEIYIKLAHKALKEGKNVLYLVPEIALSRQLEERLFKHFGDRLITFHSGESAASRRNSAETIRNLGNKDNYVALCTRSGIFLPHHDLGLIIVDEEHDSSYKQDSPAPRYNGRDSALIMSRIHKCDIVLGSATPSLEEIYNTRTGRHALVSLNERYHGTGHSEIEIIDTKAERRKRGMAGNFSRKLIDHIKAALESKEQVLILRARRAWATALQCEDCGEIQKCPHCNVSLSLHKSNGMMVCHSCGHNAPYTGQCGKCTGKLTALGAGTQKIEEEAAALFPNAVISRLDSDSSQQEKIIKDFADGSTDILVGTQMVGKGFDFSNLSLVAVIAADAMLGIQDFRADEKAYHLLEQFRGRCGRRQKAGTFVIQTCQPEHPIYANLAGASQNDFCSSLLAEREDFGFPPYSRIIELTVRDIYEDRAQRMAVWLGEKLTRWNITGPYTPVVDRIADQYLRKIRICLPKDKALSASKNRIKEIISEFEKTRRYDGHITIDVDPS